MVAIQPVIPSPVLSFSSRQPELLLNDQNDFPKVFALFRATQMLLEFLYIPSSKLRPGDVFFSDQPARLFSSHGNFRHPKVRESPALGSDRPFRRSTDKFL